ncbi:MULTISPECIES: alpha-ketoglutarate-dependent dioxygenase AlkB [unclassified Myroides]|uniref:alpha-ketoglutarate-dependent dioxygenase AlkB family protein n=1 Tax=unclassified Myroides TaxID=2642485 RepID=UPI0015FC613C|nr:MULTISPECIES: alpha-ketoglutarate-dependent dioxygenase AlkB [unclassified Myroides]MBB1149028.1 alpha-ketoglutarate-dependent dioxygenase AlkB [Myroides sp. NP-2]MDM1406210.1 alpha-ketoglutarate-dependent dioxygenase AlkB [Myroides sp. DF42-4-2]
MDLFNTLDSTQYNFLPYDGTVNCYGYLLHTEEAAFYFDHLLRHIEWKNDEAVIFGKRVITKRKVAWYGSKSFQYTYSNVTKLALPWTPELLALKDRIEKTTGETYNSCLLNLYHDGSEGMAWHSDGEKDLKKNGAIASLSLGATRKFMFKHKTTQEKVTFILESGHLLVMKDETQTFWVHRLPPTKVVHHPRINLTFRTI